MRRTPLVAAVLSDRPASRSALSGRCRRRPSAPARRRPGGARPCARRSCAPPTRLADRRSLVVGDRFYEMGAEDGSYPATGFHTRGEMGGFWTPPIKLLDGLWFKVGGHLAGRRRATPAAGATSG